MKLYQVIYADPPWEYRNKKTGGTMSSAAVQKYDTMSIDDLCMMNVPADKNAVLFLWATVPMLQEGLDVMRAWKFNYKTMLTWNKSNRLGLGYWFRGQTEHLLFGVRGKIPAFKSPRRNIINAGVKKHSEKPEEFRQLIENVTASLPNKLEMFARINSPGWDVFGNQVENSIII